MYYINYEEECNINYTFLLCLYRIAKRNQKQGILNVIKYNSLEDLKKQIIDNCGITFSIPFLSKELNDFNYKRYFIVDKQEKIIQLLNNFKGG